MRNASRLILAAVLVAGLATPIAAHIPEKCGPEMENVLKASAASVESTAAFQSLNLNESPRAVIAEAAEKMVRDSVKEGLMIAFLFSCMK